MSSGVGIDMCPLSYRDEVVEEGLLGVDAFTLDLERQKGIDHAKMWGRGL